jgi:multisubunit Na+/H+ antiporter MnhF subunit
MSSVAGNSTDKTASLQKNHNARFHCRGWLFALFWALVFLQVFTAKISPDTLVTSAATANIVSFMVLYGALVALLLSLICFVGSVRYSRAVSREISSVKEAA